MNCRELIKTFEGFHKEKLNKSISNNTTYISKKTRILDDNDMESFTLLKSKIRNYDFNKFNIEDKSYVIFIKPDDNFLKLYKELCIITGDDYEELEFYISVTGENNLIDFDGGMPKVLRGSSIGYNLYKLVINLKDYISSNRYSSKDAYNLWYNLMVDNDLYALTSNEVSILIKKDITNDKLNHIINKYDNLEMSDDLINKINDI